MKRLIQIAFVLSILGAVIAYVGYNWVFGPNTNITEDYELYIPKKSKFSQLQTILEQDTVLKSQSSFATVSKLMKYDGDNIPSGRYIIKPGWSNRQIINTLRAGLQSPIKLTISTGRHIEDIVAVVAKKIEPDSIEIMSLLQDSSYIAELGFTPETVIGMFMPDTYEMYWNTSADKFLTKMKSEYDKYWSSEDRIKALEERQMTRNEVSTMASIVEKESNSKTERPRIAGVYLNRIEQGIKLQADPTVVYGVGDFTIRRVLKKHLEYESPYNTYINEGLPPGPICMPSKSSIDAVLNPEQHDYIFFCAKPGYNGEHLFAKTNRQHEKNASIYHRWLNKERILK